MSNYIEYKDKIAFHPGYYIKEIVEESGLTQADFAKKLDTTPKNLSVLISGEQSLSIDIATKLSRMLGTSVNYWLNLQQSFDAIKAEYVSEKLYEEEQEVFKSMDYDFFVECYHLSQEDNSELRIKRLREYLRLSSLRVLKNRELSISLKEYEERLSEEDVINANAIIQASLNTDINTVMPKYNKKKFAQAVDYVIHEGIESSEEVKNVFELAGVRFLLLPNKEDIKISSFSKKLNDRVVLAVNDKIEGDDSFLPILSKEANHILNNEFGISFFE